jgi:hypothetical protein
LFILEFKKGCEDWHYLFDLAAVSQNKIPKSVPESDANVKFLYRCYRSVFKTELTAEKLDEFREALNKMQADHKAKH